jgi:glycosyltransferase involved in cell wall biosynthesis
MKILFVSPFFPYPSVPHAGGVYVFRLIEALTRRNHSVSLLSFVTAEESVHIAEMERICHRVVTVPIDPSFRKLLKNIPRHLLQPVTFQVWHPDFSAALDRMISETQFDVVQLFWSETGQYVGVLKDRFPTVLCAIDVIVPTLERTFRNERNLFRKIWLYWYWRNAEWYESRVYPRFNHVLTLSEKDQTYIIKKIPHAEANVLFPWVDEKLLRHPIELNRSKDILFVGNMKRPPNVDAVLWFYREVFPLVRAQVPEARLCIVGDAPAPVIQALRSDQNVVVTGKVDRVDDYCRSCRLTIVPLFIGGGIIKKALDALATGCPVVATTIGVEGIDVHHEREALVADSPQQFAVAVTRLLRDDLLWMQLAQAGRELVCRNYNWTTTVAGLEHLYKKLVFKKQESGL